MKIEDILLLEGKVRLKDSILALGLDNYQNTALYNSDILYVYQLLNLRISDLTRLKGIGKKAADKIVYKVHNEGFKFMNEMNREEKNTFVKEIQDKSLKEVIYIDDALIETLNLSMRSYNALTRANIICLSQLIDCTISELMRVRNLGDKSLQEVISKVHELGLFFKGESTLDCNVIVKLNDCDCVYSATKILKEENDEIQSSIELKSDLIQRYKEAKNRNESLRDTDKKLDQILLQILMIEDYDFSSEKEKQNNEQERKQYIKSNK